MEKAESFICSRLNALGFQRVASEAPDQAIIWGYIWGYPVGSESL
jgi:hypothetical protein